MKLKATNYLIILATLLVSTSMFSQLKVSKLFNNHMVIQRNHKINIWGSNNEMKTVSILFNNKSYKTKTDSKGDWKIDLPEMKERGLRTLDIFVSTLVKETGGKLPENFIVMLPKVTIPEQPETLANFFSILEILVMAQRHLYSYSMMYNKKLDQQYLRLQQQLYQLILRQVLLLLTLLIFSVQ